MSVNEVHQEAGVALVTLNRPDAHNALNRALSEAIIATFADLAADEGVRAIVLTGAGRAFCAGVDLKALTDEPELLSSGLGLGPESPIVVALEQCPQPIIGAVNGAAVTGGFELALAAMMVRQRARALRRYPCPRRHHRDGVCRKNCHASLASIAREK